MCGASRVGAKQRSCEDAVAGVQDLPQSLSPDDYLGADLGSIIQVDRVLVRHANAAGGNSAPDLPWLVGAVDAIQRVAKIKRASAERIVLAAGHMPRQIGKALQFARSWGPVGPFAFRGNSADARPIVAFGPDGDAVSDRLVITEHVVKIALARIDNDRPGLLTRRVGDCLPI